MDSSHRLLCRVAVAERVSVLARELVWSKHHQAAGPLGGNMVWRSRRRARCFTDPLGWDGGYFVIQLLISKDSKWPTLPVKLTLMQIIRETEFPHGDGCPLVLKQANAPVAPDSHYPVSSRTPRRLEFLQCTLLNLGTDGCTLRRWTSQS